MSFKNFLLALVCFTGFLSGLRSFGDAITVMADPSTGDLKAPLTFFSKNILPGTNIIFSTNLANGKVTISSSASGSGSGGSATNVYFYPSTYATWSVVGGSNMVSIVGLQPTNTAWSITNAAGWISQLGDGSFVRSNAVTRVATSVDTNGVTTWKTNTIPVATLDPRSGSITLGNGTGGRGVMTATIVAATTITTNAASGDATLHFSGGTSFSGPMEVGGLLTLDAGGAGDGSGFTDLTAGQLVGEVPMVNLSTNIPVVTNYPFAVGQALIYVGTNASGQPIFEPTSLIQGSSLQSNKVVATDANTNFFSIDIPTGGGASALKDSSFYIRDTNAIVLDLAQFQTFDVGILTNGTIIISNAPAMTNLACHDFQINFHQWTNGQSRILTLLNASGKLTTNGSWVLTTNGNSTDILFGHVDGTKSNIVLTAITNCSNYIDTNTLATGGGGGLACDSVNDASLVSYWELGEASGTRADSKGSETLTDSGSTGNATGIIGNGANFSGSTSLSHASDANLQTTTSTAWSVSAWFNVTAINSGFFQAIVSKKGEWSLYIDGTLSKVKITFNDGSGANNTVTETGTVSAGAWHHVVATHDTDGTTKIYIDGALDCTPLAEATVYAAGSSKFEIGAADNSGSDIWNASGVIDEVLFTKKVLSSTDVSNLYSSGGACKPTGL